MLYILLCRTAHYSIQSSHRGIVDIGTGIHYTSRATGYDSFYRTPQRPVRHIKSMLQNTSKPFAAYLVYVTSPRDHIVRIIGKMWSMDTSHTGVSIASALNELMICTVRHRSVRGPCRVLMHKEIGSLRTRNNQIKFQTFLSSVLIQHIVCEVHKNTLENILYSLEYGAHVSTRSWQAPGENASGYTWQPPSWRCALECIRPQKTKPSHHCAITK